MKFLKFIKTFEVLGKTDQDTCKIEVYGILGTISKNIYDHGDMLDQKSQSQNIAGKILETTPIIVHYNL